MILFYKKGFTLIEVLAVIAISVILFLLIWSALARFNDNQILNKTTVEVMSALEQARSLTLASKNNTMHGVHLQSDKVILFEGNIFSSSDSKNEEIILDSIITILDISLSGGGNDVVFERLTGKTNQDGTITLSIISDTSQTKTITIHSTGIIEL